MMMKNKTDGTSPSSATPKWYLAYFLLAAFDLLTVSGSLYLNHTIMDRFSDSVSVNGEWAHRLGELAILRVLAGETNAPGNNVFDTHDVAGESRKLAIALQAFVQQREKMEQELSHNLPPDEAEPLLENLQTIQKKVDEMVEEAQSIYSFFLLIQPERAGERMATMDRKYAMVHAAITTVETQFRSTQVSLLNHQEAMALGFQRFEYVIAVFIVLMIGMASIYGHRIYKEMKIAAHERDGFLRQLQKAAHMKTTFFTDISHELRTPITVIRGEAEVTLRGKVKPLEEYRSVLERIVRLSDHLQKLVNDLLFLARSESGSLEMNKHRVNVQKILREAAADAEVLAKKKGITLEFPSHGNTVMIHADPQRLRQVFFIVLDNAIHYTPIGGKVDICSKKNGQYTHIVITDNGIGISPENLDLVFNRFYRIPNQNGHRSPGTGLGLPIAKWITEAHDGSISLVSSLGK
ncbi:MAG: HAMP domain-containing sensor histidine kinase, partial [Nitrospirota bacterium]|nr:HAMP domain-containing sensor histidine kinase [Nitrospirota bacterium]